jgi:DNA-directed RNA polymerase specialized sigma24 family protein
MSLEAVLELETSTVAHRPRADRDLDLLEALRLHEPTAAERLVTTYGERAYRLAASITGNGQDAEEVVQDAFWTVVRKIETFRGESAFGSWLYRIVANAAYQKIRGRRPVPGRGTPGVRCTGPPRRTHGRLVGPRGRPLGPD